MYIRSTADGYEVFLIDLYTLALRARVSRVDDTDATSSALHIPGGLAQRLASRDVATAIAIANHAELT